MKHKTRVYMVYGAIAGCIAGSMLAVIADRGKVEGPQTALTQPVIAAPAAPSPEEALVIKIFEQASPSVVSIKSAVYARDFFSLDIYEIPQGVGTGFIWDKGGYIVTNFHVVSQASSIEVTLSDQKSYPAEVKGVAPDYDLAVLKIDAPAEKLAALAVGTSADLQVGRKVLVIGNPFGLDHSLTTGVVSALGRSINAVSGRKIYDMIQTDAAINPGNSGGPLLDLAGRLIGVATAIYSPSGAYAGVGFAIPVDTVQRIVPQLIQYGKVKRVGLGISLLPDAIRDRFGLQGAVIMEVAPGGSAAKAGLQPTYRDNRGQVLLGDVIVAVDGKSVTSNEDIIAIFDQKYQAGDSVTIEFTRNSLRKKTTAILQDL